MIELDVIRAIEREPESLEAFLGELEPEPRAHAEAALPDADEPGARRLVEALATALQASLLLRHAPAEVADAFVATRLRGDRGGAYGTLPRGLAVDAIVDRHRPRL